VPIDYLNPRARRVVTGVDADGKSAIVKDENTSTRITLPLFTLNDIWRLDSLPSRVDDDETLTGEVELDPPPTGLVVRLATVPPDSEVDPVAQRESIEVLHDTVDVVTVVSGEIYAVLETGETLLRRGDTIIHRANKHTWSNRTDRPVTVLVLMVPATR
jgi:mannose-6-phosphate isomerase-like protein (cupin superfamily)